MFLNRYIQQPGEKLKRIIDYARWLEADELIQSVTAVISPATDVPLTCNTIVIDPGGKKIAYFIEGGEDGTSYTVTLTIVTQTQRREDEIEIEVEEQT